MTDVIDIPEPDALAGEYVLRLLDPDAEKDAELRIASDASFAASVRDWEAYFAAFAAEVLEVAPPAAIKRRVLDAVAPSERRGRWGLGLFAGLALAAMVVIALLLPVLRNVGLPEPQYQAELVSESGDLVIRAGFAPDQNLLIVTQDTGGPRPGRVLELWLIAEGATAPVSLGVLGDGPRLSIVVDADTAALVPTGTLAVSDEPPGGSQTGAPTGDVLAAAGVSAL